jgi:hypothetical protein
MADNKVLSSIEAPGGRLCVDFFQRPDGSWGFEEYRRDPEDPRGWARTGFFGETCFSTKAEAEQAAAAAVAWFDT